jgi:hypothetical protein
MQRIATKTFITASILFGLTGISMMLFTPIDAPPSQTLTKLLGVLGFVVLSSFAVSIALKYLGANGHK